MSETFLFSTISWPARGSIYWVSDAFFPEVKKHPGRGFYCRPPTCVEFKIFTIRRRKIFSFILAQMSSSFDRKFWININTILCVHCTTTYDEITFAKSYCGLGKANFPSVELPTIFPQDDIETSAYSWFFLLVKTTLSLGQGLWFNLWLALRWYIGQGFRFYSIYTECDTTTAIGKASYPSRCMHSSKETEYNRRFCDPQKNSMSVTTLGFKPDVFVTGIYSLLLIKF